MQILYWSPPNVSQRGCDVSFCYAPNFEKVGDILVSACLCVYVFMFEILS